MTTWNGSESVAPRLDQPTCCRGSFRSRPRELGQCFLRFQGIERIYTGIGRPARALRNRICRTTAVGHSLSLPRQSSGWVAPLSTRAAPG